MNSGWDSNRLGDKEGAKVGELSVFQMNVIYNF
jgi:hypothetical protein